MLLEAARDAGIRHLQISTDEVYGSIEEGTFTEQSPIEPSSPYSASKAGGDMIVRAYNHTYGADCLIVRASNNYGPYQHPEKLIPLMILNAMAGDRLPVYGDGMQVRNWLFTEDFAAAIDVVLERGEAGEVYNVGGPEEMTNIDVVTRILELTGRDETQIDHVADRLGHDRRYSLSSDRTEGLGWSAQVGFDEGIRAHGRLVPRASGVVGADPRRRVPRVLRAPVRHEARRRLVTAAVETRLEGLVAIEPTAFGDERGFLIESFSAERWRDMGIDETFVQENHSRSTQRGTPARHALPDRSRAGQAGPLPARRDLRRRRRPAPRLAHLRQWEGHVLDDERHRQLWVPIGFAHGFQVLSEIADVAYKLTSLYDPATESEIAWDDPEVGIEWPVPDPLLSDRDKAAPRLAEVADSLPFTY